jgi:hypothetical protein
VLPPSRPVRGEHRDAVVGKMTNQIPDVLLHSTDPWREVVCDHEEARNAEGLCRFQRAAPSVSSATPPIVAARLLARNNKSCPLVGLGQEDDPIPWQSL